MKTTDLRKESRSLSDVLALAQSEAVLVRSASGKDFVVEPADEFDREVASLGGSRAFMSFLEERSNESEDLTLEEVRRKHGLDAPD